jgi:3-methyladenine DNA glycosylase/8-oxoguanine DNA glycosylase
VNPSILQIPVQPPYNAQALLRFLAPRAIAGVEHIAWEASEGRLRRALRWGEESICLEASFAPSPSSLQLAVYNSGSGKSSELAKLARQVLDTDTAPELYSACLGEDPHLAPLLKAQAGLRVPGAWDYFEMGVRAILGQQISVAAAHTLAGRVAARFGTAIESPWPEVRLLWPTAQTMAEARPEDLCALGLTRKRAETVIAFARHQADASSAELQSLPGIGPWTASYLDLRAGNNRDAFPAGDLGIQKALGIDTAKPAVAKRIAEERSQSWRPWRSYAVMLLWSSLAKANQERA